MRRHFLSALALIALIATGCTTLREPDALDVGIVDVVSGDATFWETSLVFSIRLQNASPEPLVLEGSSHKIYFNGSYVGQGLSSERVEIPRLGTATQQITVRARNLVMLKKLVEMSESSQPSVQYRVRSTFFGGGRFGGRRVTTREGSLDLGKLASRARGN